ncbi:hypothetical protein STENM327S_07386 [Streptomyces tendae]
MAAWTWRFETADGTEVQPAVQPEEFTTQGDAESWIGEQWKDLQRAAPTRCGSSRTPPRSTAR